MPALPWPRNSGTLPSKSRAFVTEIQKQEDLVGGLLLERKQGKTLNEALTVRQWSARWVLSRKACGHTSTRDDESRLEHHILPRIGDKLMSSVPRSEVEGLGWNREHLGVHCNWPRSP